MIGMCTQGFPPAADPEARAGFELGSAIAGTVDPYGGRSRCERMVYVFADGQNAPNSTTPDDDDGSSVWSRW